MLQAEEGMCCSFTFSSLTLSVVLSVGQICDYLCMVRGLSAAHISVCQLLVPLSPCLADCVPVNKVYCIRFNLRDSSDSSLFLLCIWTLLLKKNYLNMSAWYPQTSHGEKNPPQGAVYYIPKGLIQEHCVSGVSTLYQNGNDS